MIVIESPAGIRRLQPEELPIRIGSTVTADIRVPDPVGDTLDGLIGCLDGRAFLQASGEQTAVLEVNGEPASATRWLLDGDVIASGSLRIHCRLGDDGLRFVVDYADSGYQTLPPELPAPVAATPVLPLPAGQSASSPRRSGGRRSWWLYGGLLVLALAAIQLFSSRAVDIQVVPAHSHVSVDGGWPAFSFGSRWLLRPGEYTATISAAGYEELRRPLVVDRARSQIFQFELQPLPGRLVLQGAPEAPLELRVDGERVEPLADGSYPAMAGSRKLWVGAKRYRPWEGVVEVEGRDRQQDLLVALVPDWAEVTITSEPAGAGISSGGELLGLTPATVAVAVGSPELELRLEGYKPWRRQLELEAGTALELPLVRLEESDGLLGVLSHPAGASVSIDGRYRGKTPLEVEVAPGKAHQVLVAMPGHESASRSITVAPRTSASLQVELAPRIGIVRVESDPADAEVWINGVSHGQAGRDLELLAVPQRIEVRKAGLETFSTELTPSPGMLQKVDARLRSPQEAATASLSATLTTGQGQVLRLIGPGEFQLGTPRGDQGRRSNETLQQVRITRHYYMAVHQVSNREFREFRPQHTSGAEKYRQLAGSDHPVVMLSWEDAVRYCNWLSEKDGLEPAYVLRGGAFRLADPETTGYRLPSEAEWAWASRYNGGRGEQRYPWGDRMPPEAGSGNFADQSARSLVANVLEGYSDGYPVTAPVGSFRPSTLGLHDLGGNVAEWVNDIYTVYAAGGALLVDPRGPAGGQHHVIRGSGWRHASISELRYAYRDFGDQGRLDVGFRLARNAR